MANVSRRDFLKYAGTAALAVAAAGVLTGCSKDDVPVIPDVTTRKVTVKFVLEDGTKVGEQLLDVLKTENRVSSTQLTAPEGYKLVVLGDLFIEEDDTVSFKVEEVEAAPETKQISVIYKGYYEGGFDKVITQSVTVPADLEVFNTAKYADQLTGIPEGWELASKGDFNIENNTVTLKIWKPNT